MKQQLIQHTQDMKCAGYLKRLRLYTDFTTGFLMIARNFGVVLIWISPYNPVGDSLENDWEIVVVVDQLTKRAYCIPTITIASASGTAQRFIKVWKYHGLPVNDSGT